MTEPSDVYLPRLARMIIAISESLETGRIVHGFGGALALAYAVENPRATADIDINIVSDPARPERALSKLPDGVSYDEDDLNAIRKDGQVRLWWTFEDAQRVPIDLFFPQHAFHATVAGRMRTVPFGARDIPIISATDILIFKALFNRPQDWVDIAEIVKADTADLEEAFEWLAQLIGIESQSYRRLGALIKDPTQGVT